MQHPADVGALAVRLAGVVGVKRLRLIRETVELDADVLLLAETVQGRPRLAQRLEHGLPARPVGLVLDRHALGAVEDDVEHGAAGVAVLGEGEGRPQDRHGGEQEGGARRARMAATRRGGRPDPRYVAAVSPARAIGTTYSNARPTPASRPSQTPPDAVISSGVSQAWPTAAHASSPMRTRPQPSMRRRRRHGDGLADKQDRQRQRHDSGRQHGGDDGGRGRGQALKQQPPRPDGVDHECHDEAPSPSGLPAAAGDRS